MTEHIQKRNNKVIISIYRLNKRNKQCKKETSTLNADLGPRQYYLTIIVLRYEL